jgi:hypothetical protein
MAMADADGGPHQSMPPGGGGWMGLSVMGHGLCGLVQVGRQGQGAQRRFGLVWSCLVWFGWGQEITQQEETRRKVKTGEKTQRGEVRMVRMDGGPHQSMPMRWPADPGVAHLSARGAC